MTGPEPKATPPPSPDAGHVPISEEMDRARWTLPPALPVVAAALIVALIVAVYTYRSSRPLGAGKILGVYAVEQASKTSVLVGVQVAVQNTSKQAVIIKSASVRVMPAAGGADSKLLEDEAASAVDFERYFQAYPELAQHKMEALRPETRLLPGESTQGMVIVSFPLSKDAFDRRQSLRVVVILYDHSVPVVIK